MRHILIILPFLFLSSTLFGQSKDECYLFVYADIGKDKPIIEQIAKPFIASYISPLKEIPLSGLTQSEVDSSCNFEVTVTSTDGTITLSIDSTRTPISFNGLSKSNRSLP